MNKKCPHCIEIEELKKRVDEMNKIIEELKQEIAYKEMVKQSRDLTWQKDGEEIMDKITEQEYKEIK